MCIIFLWVSQAVLLSGLAKLCEHAKVPLLANLGVPESVSWEVSLASLTSYHPRDYPRNFHRGAMGFCQAMRKTKPQPTGSLQASA